jgi:hypothetical protein
VGRLRDLGQRDEALSIAPVLNDRDGTRVVIDRARQDAWGRQAAAAGRFDRSA